MAITWTIFVLGALLHDMQCNSMESTTPASTESTSPASTDSTKSVSEVSTSTTLQTPILSPSSNPIIPSTISNISTTLMPNTPNTNTNPNPSTATEPILSIEQINITPTKLISSSVPPLKSTTNSLKDSTLSLTTLTILTTKEQTEQPGTSDSPQVTTQITTLQPTIPNTNTSPTASNLHTPPFSQETTSSNTPAVTTHEESGTSPDKQTDLSAVTTNPAPKPTLTVSQSTQKQETQTTSAPITSTTLPATSRPDYLATSTSTPGNLTYPVFDLSRSSEGNVVLEACKMLGKKMKGNCSATLDIQGKKLIATITINADQIIKTENYKPQEQKDDVVSKKEPIPDTLIAILASSGALVLILCCFAAYCTYHRRSYRKNQQHLTEELQTVENGYHDNPTLEVMEVQPEMQEKKLTLNGEFNDSWIVPLDNLLKEDLPDEEDTHL